MKICTDACIFGAFVEVENARKILDIGTGTGVLALMMAQRSKAVIHTVEIDESAYNQAVINIEQSIFREQITVFHKRIQDFFLPESLSLYDLIVSNPPFFQNSLQSLDYQANKAIHAVELTLEELMETVARLLKFDGKFMVLLPPHETLQVCQIATKLGFFMQHQLSLKHDKSKPIFRIISTFSKVSIKCPVQNTLVIWDENKQYSNDFRTLLNDYYTIF